MAEPKALSASSLVDPACLQCGESRSRVHAESLFCVTISGGLQPEVDQEWERHRWADWNDAELARFGVKPEAFERHRRTDASTFGWIDCEDLARGHIYATAQDHDSYGWPIGRCLACYQLDPNATDICETEPNRETR